MTAATDAAVVDTPTRRLQVQDTAIAGVRIVATRVVADHRGGFLRLFCADELAPVLAGRRIVQINHSRTAPVGACGDCTSSVRRMPR